MSSPRFLSRLPVWLGAAAGALAALAAPPAARAATCPPEAGECASLAANGSLAANVDLVIVGDGYTAEEKEKFFEDAKAVTDGLLGSETYGAYRAVFNAWALFTPSAESGADDPSQGVAVDTAFNASYDTSGIDYLLSVSTSKVFAEVNARFPESDLVLCIVNATPYGGAGGAVAVVSLDPSSIEIARHELGHTIADLADEYTAPYPGFPEGDPEPNVAAAEHLDPVKWEHWLTPGVAIPTPSNDATGVHTPIGAYEGARYKETGVFRPAPNCLMRELNITFCPVCAEAMVKQLSAMSLLIDAPVPPSFTAIPGKGPTVFTATYPALDTLVFSWAIDGAMVAETGASLAVDPAKLGLADGPHEVTLGVYDATPLVRDDPDGVMKETFTWSISVDSSLPPVNDGSGGAGGGGDSGGGDDDPDCGCRAAGEPAPASLAWLLLGLAPLARVRRRRRLR